MLPKKTRRNVHVDGVLYHYIIGSFSGDTRFVIQNTVTGEKFSGCSDHHDTIRPSDMEDIIHTGEYAGFPLREL